MPKPLELNVPLTPEQYSDVNLPYELAKNVADAINKTLGTDYTATPGFQVNSINISLYGKAAD